ncbi:MAG: 5-(carboxyamino)imidazole ribonucleotide mutase [Phormidesmis sp. RL_2_1]|nr:5-(carboxyamino)imidazole ribonucleotide mutase [Phormidesmis sp. RL_2_1]
MTTPQAGGPAGGQTDRQLDVGIVMGSDSDLPTMMGAIAICEKFDIPHEVTILSAHRTPQRMVTYAESAHTRGLKVIIAGAGGAAHLPGMVAALSPLPVIGVPVKTSTLSGVDSLYSIVQMPGGIPVATVAIGNAKNAGLLAVQILATHDTTLLEKVLTYRQQLKATVNDKQHQLTALGARQYLKQMINT